ncbi:MAG: hypothetical protein K2M10_04190, partial [Muribaculaceae bacterium]|nr:hypothetical protein [Muribaculaceae bacterium]
RRPFYLMNGVYKTRLTTLLSFRQAVSVEAMACLFFGRLPYVVGQVLNHKAGKFILKLNRQKFQLQYERQQKRK